MEKNEIACPCTQCGKPGCKCSSEAAASAANCCCGDECQCGAACKCPTGCGCASTRESAR